MERVLFQKIIDQHLESLFAEQIEIAEAELELAVCEPTTRIKDALRQLSGMWDKCEEKIAVLEGRCKPKEAVDWSKPARSKGKHTGVHEIPRDWRADVVGTLLIDEAIQLEEAMPKYEELGAPKPEVDLYRQDKVRAWIHEHQNEFKITVSEEM